LDVRNNTNLKTFICHTNKLSSLDVSNNLEMTFLNCYKNQLTFKSIPQVKTSYSSYYYAPQANLTATCSGGMVDLSSQLTATDVNGNNQTTVYKWFLADGTELATITWKKTACSAFL
jgi:PKD repeat protein